MSNKYEVRKAKETYLPGVRVRLVKMDDAQAPPTGTKGTVYGVDDTGSILVSWDNGSQLNVIFGVDIIRKTTDK